MVNNQLLLDDFSIKGTDAKGLEENIEKVTEATGELVVHGKDLTFLSLCMLKDYQVEGKLTFFVLSPEYLDDFLSEGKKLRCGTVPIDQLGQDLADELVNTTKMLVVIDNEKYILSEKAIKTLTRQTGLGGDEMISKHGFARNLYLATCVFERNEKLKIVYREENGVRKIFGFFKHKYARYPQTMLTDAIKKLGVTVTGWTISQDVTEIFAQYGKSHSDYTPGIFFRTSDIGRSSLIARCVVSFATGGYLVLDEIPFIHCKKHLGVDIADEISSFPDKLEEFSKAFDKNKDREIDDYTNVDFRNEKDCLQNRKIVKEAVFDAAVHIFAGIAIPKGRFEAAFADLDRLDAMKAAVAAGNKNAKKKAEWKCAKSVYNYVTIEDRNYTVSDIIAICLKAIDVLEENGLDESTVTEMRRCNFLDLANNL